MSGGTTGSPKGALGQHRSLVAAGLQSHAWLQPVWEDWHDSVMLPLPLFHAYGFIGGQSIAFVGHNPLLLIPNPRDIADVVRTMGRVRPTFANRRNAEGEFPVDQKEGQLQREIGATHQAMEEKITMIEACVHEALDGSKATVDSLMESFERIQQTVVQAKAQSLDILNDLYVSLKHC